MNNLEEFNKSELTAWRVLKLIYQFEWIDANYFYWKGVTFLWDSNHNLPDVISRLWSDITKITWENISLKTQTFKTSLLLLNNLFSIPYKSEIISNELIEKIEELLNELKKIYLLPENFFQKKLELWIFNILENIEKLDDNDLNSFFDIADEISKLIENQFKKWNMKINLKHLERIKKELKSWKKEITIDRLKKIKIILNDLKKLKAKSSGEDVPIKRTKKIITNEKERRKIFSLRDNSQNLVFMNFFLSKLLDDDENIPSNIERIKSTLLQTMNKLRDWWNIIIIDRYDTTYDHIFSILNDLSFRFENKVSKDWNYVTFRIEKTPYFQTKDLN